MIRKFLFLIAFGLLLQQAQVHAQTLTLDQSYTMAVQNYPLIQQRELIQKSGTYSLENISKGALPQLAINGQTTYQSDVTQIPIKLPNMDIPVLSKDQYKLYGEINQPLTDLITVKQQKELQSATTENQQQNLEVELYKLKDRVNQLFFGILLLDEQLKQNGLTKVDIQTGINKVSAAIQNGTELKSSLDKLKAEMLKAEQRDIEIRASRKAYADMLGLLLHQPLSETVVLVNPAPVTTTDTINRPELKAFQAQQKMYDVQTKLLQTKNLPKFSLFFQGGIGKPALNMLSNDLKSYYIGGARLNWSLSGFYTYKKERKLLDINKKMTDVQQETFLFNTRSTLKQQNAEILKLQELLQADSAIVALRTSIKNMASAQLQNGVISVNDYLKEVNNDDMARQMASYHAVQLSLALYSYKTTSGN